MVLEVASFQLQARYFQSFSAGPWFQDVELTDKRSSKAGARWLFRAKRSDDLHVVLGDVEDDQGVFQVESILEAKEPTLHPVLLSSRNGGFITVLLPRTRIRQFTGLGLLRPCLIRNPVILFCKRLCVNPVEEMSPKLQSLRPRTSGRELLRLKRPFRSLSSPKLCRHLLLGKSQAHCHPILVLDGDCLYLALSRHSTNLVTLGPMVGSAHTDNFGLLQLQPSTRIVLNLKQYGLPNAGLMTVECCRMRRPLSKSTLTAKRSLDVGQAQAELQAHKVHV